MTKMHLFFLSAYLIYLFVFKIITITKLVNGAHPIPSSPLSPPQITTVTDDHHHQPEIPSLKLQPNKTLVYKSNLKKMGRTTLIKSKIRDWSCSGEKERWWLGLSGRKIKPKRGGQNR